MIKETWIKIATNTLVGTLAGCIPAGAVLAYWFNDEHWLWLCLPLLIFLS